MEFHEGLKIQNGLWGTARARPKIALLAGFLMLLEGIPLLLSVGPLSFVAGGALVWSAWRELPQTQGIVTK